jgi:hypothetical protein
MEDEFDLILFMQQRHLQSPFTVARKPLATAEAQADYEAVIALRRSHLN